MKMENDDIWEAVLKFYDDSRYPKEFLSKYAITECLSERKGTDTFLLTKKGADADESFIAKCFDKSVFSIQSGEEILEGLEHPGIPHYIETFENDTMLIKVRSFIQGVPLSRYALENDLNETEVIDICIKLCDILSFLHERKNPIIHRDIKPQNIVIKPKGDVALIDFDISRIYRRDNETDTCFFGTLAYAPPEQYGFSQTDVRSDIYSLGVLLRWLLTKNAKPNKNIQVRKSLQKIIDKCTAFAPKERFSNVAAVKKSLQAANPKKQKVRRIFAASLACVFLAAATYAGVRIYQHATYDPLVASGIPANLSAYERMEDAVSFLNEKHHTDIFENTGEAATVGDLKKVLIEVYGLNYDYVYGFVPSENFDDEKERRIETDEYFLPWAWGDEQNVQKNVVVYSAVKLFDPELVADWSEIKDDNGYYPGIRVATKFAEENGILTGTTHPTDISKGELALIFSNTERVFSVLK